MSIQNCGSIHFNNTLTNSLSDFEKWVVSQQPIVIVPDNKVDWERWICNLDSVTKYVVVNNDDSTWSLWSAWTEYWDSTTEQWLWDPHWRDFSPTMPGYLSRWELRLQSKNEALELARELIIPDPFLWDGTKIVGLNQRQYPHPDPIDLEIPDGATEIGVAAFSENQALRSVVIPESVGTIGTQSFDGCRALEWVDLPKNITRIGWSSFANCKALQSVILPEGTTTINDFAFAGSGLHSIWIPESVTEIGYKAFSNCPNLTIHTPAGSKAEEYAKENKIPCATRRAFLYYHGEFMDICYTPNPVGCGAYSLSLTVGTERGVYQEWYPDGLSWEPLSIPRWIIDHSIHVIDNPEVYLCFDDESESESDPWRGQLDELQLECDNAISKIKRRRFCDRKYCKN